MFIVLDPAQSSSVDSKRKSGMRKIVCVSLIWIYLIASHANNVRQIVDPGSLLEKELAINIEIKDTHDAWRDTFGEKFINGSSSTYMVTLNAMSKGKLSEYFGMTLTLKHENELIIQVPLEASAFDHDKISVEFLVNKNMLHKSELTFRCGSPLNENSFIVPLENYISEKNN